VDRKGKRRKWKREIKRVIKVVNMDMQFWHAVMAI
jgi:hypothetical protein